MKNFIRDSYNRDAKTYDQKFWAIQKIKYDTLLKNNLNSLKPALIKGPILDLGTGTGLVTRFFQENSLPIKNLYGLDFSMKMIKIAKEKGIRVVLGDKSHLPFPDRFFGLVMAFTVLRIMTENDLPILKEIHRVLQPNSPFIVTILARNKDPLFAKNLEKTGFKISSPIPAGQDVGFICYKSK